MTLTVQEKEDLYTVIKAAFGDDVDIRIRTIAFNEQTVEVVEEALSEESKCNMGLQQLVGGLISGGSIFVKGWLKKGLSILAKELKGDIKLFNGYGCRIATRAKWKSPIILTTI